MAVNEPRDVMHERSIWCRSAGGSVTPGPRLDWDVRGWCGCVRCVPLNEPPPVDDLPWTKTRCFFPFSPNTISWWIYAGLQLLYTFWIKMASHFCYLSFREVASLITCDSLNSLRFEWSKKNNSIFVRKTLGKQRFSPRMQDVKLSEIGGVNSNVTVTQTHKDFHTHTHSHRFLLPEYPMEFSPPWSIIQTVLPLLVTGNWV